MKKNRVRRIKELFPIINREKICGFYGIKAANAKDILHKLDKIDRISKQFYLRTITIIIDGDKRIEWHNK